MPKIIRITAKKDGFRRGGLTHSTTATDYPDWAFEPEELEALKAEPMLVVQKLDAPEPGNGGSPPLPPPEPNLAAEPEKATPAEVGDKAKETGDGGKAAASGDAGKAKSGK